MLLHSGRKYFPDHLDMEVKLDLILKELQNLNLIVHEFERGNFRESQ